MQTVWSEADADHETKVARAVQRFIDKADNGNMSNKTDARMTPEPKPHQIEGLK